MAVKVFSALKKWWFFLVLTPGLLMVWLFAVAGRGASRMPRSCASLQETILWNKCISSLKIRNIKAKLCTPKVVGYGFRPEESLPGARLEGQRTLVLGSCQGADGVSGGRRQLRPGSFAASSVTSICRAIAELPMGEREHAPLYSFYFQELPLI